jgi:Asp-tRNA(Asn)/Glu-tRNA(Gln) amidotransferase C subunit
MPDSQGPRITTDTIRHLARVAGVRPAESSYAELAAALEQMVVAIDRCDELDLLEHEPCTTLTLSGGPIDAER